MGMKQGQTDRVVIMDIITDNIDSTSVAGGLYGMMIMWYNTWSMARVGKPGPIDVARMRTLEECLAQFLGKTRRETRVLLVKHFQDVHHD